MQFVILNLTAARLYCPASQCLGSKFFFDKGVEADEYLQKYLTEYNKVYSRRYRADGKQKEEFSHKDMTAEEYSAWVTAAGKASSDYLEGKITGEEMLKMVRGE